VGERFSAPVQTGSEAQPAYYKMGTGSFPRVESDRGVTLTPYPLLVPKSKNGVGVFVACKMGETYLLKEMYFMKIKLQKI
jgi:hypothetical protein